METETLKQKIEQAQTRYLKSKIHSDRWQNVRASGIGDDCLRRIYYRMTEGELADESNLERQAYFCEGIDQEPGVKRYLSELGFEVLTPELTHRWAGISCKPDGVMDGALVEIKTVSEAAWQSLERPEDFLESKYHKRWYAQLQAGMLLFDKDKGVFILKRKAAKQIRVIEVDLDYDYADRLLKKAESVNEAVKQGLPPDFLQNNPAECRACPFFAKSCQPPMDYGDNIVDIQDAEIEKALSRRDELEVMAKEYEGLDKELKTRFRDIPDAFCGQWHITVKDRKMTKYEVPENVKQQYKIEGVAKIVKIEKIEK